MERLSDMIEQSMNTYYSQWVREALDELPYNFTVTDPTISDHPIVHASQGFLKMSGFSKDEVIGRNGRVFQGFHTHHRSVMEIREAIREERATQVDILNYRKDGTPFWMLFHMNPIFNKHDGRVIHFVGVHVPLKRFFESGLSELCDRGSHLHEVVYGSCRREVCFDSPVKLKHLLAHGVNSNSGVIDIEEPRVANDIEKRNACDAINSILSVLTHYSESTGRLVCGNRCGFFGISPINSSVTISLGRIKQSFVLIDPFLTCMPIVYASDAFLNLTGYSRLEVLGCNWSFICGSDTDPSTIQQIEESIQNKQSCTVRIFNYRKDNSSFWNLLHISPVRNAPGKIAYIVGVCMEESLNKQNEQGLAITTRQFSIVGAIKVVVRSLSAGPHLSHKYEKNQSEFQF